MVLGDRNVVALKGLRQSSVAVQVELQYGLLLLKVVSNNEETKLHQCSSLELKTDDDRFGTVARWTR